MGVVDRRDHLHMLYEGFICVRGGLIRVPVINFEQPPLKIRQLLLISEDLLVRHVG